MKTLTLLLLTIAAAVPPEDAERDWNEPPSGSPADQALWRDLRKAGVDAVTAMGRVAQGAYRLRYAKYYESLDARIAATSGDEQEQARAARARLSAAARAADAATPKKGLRVRKCKYIHRDFAQRMDLLADPEIAKDMATIREQAKGCLREVSAFAAKLAPFAADLERALAETDVFLGRAPPIAPTSPAGEQRSSSP
jgi:hypothetical protein